MKITPESIKRGLTTDPKDIQVAMNEFHGQVAILTGEISELQEKVNSVPRLRDEIRKLEKNLDEKKRELNNAEKAAPLLRERQDSLKKFQDGIRDVQNFISKLPKK